MDELRGAAAGAGAEVLRLHQRGSQAARGGVERRARSSCTPCMPGGRHDSPLRPTHASPRRVPVRAAPRRPRERARTADDQHVEGASAQHRELVPAPRGLRRRVCPRARRRRRGSRGGWPRSGGSRHNDRSCAAASRQQQQAAAGGHCAACARAGQLARRRDVSRCETRRWSIEALGAFPHGSRSAASPQSAVPRRREGGDHDTSAVTWRQDTSRRRTDLPAARRRLCLFHSACFRRATMAFSAKRKIVKEAGKVRTARARARAAPAAPSAARQGCAAVGVTARRAAVTGLSCATSARTACLMRVRLGRADRVQALRPAPTQAHARARKTLMHAPRRVPAPRTPRVRARADPGARRVRGVCGAGAVRPRGDEQRAEG